MQLIKWSLFNFLDCILHLLSLCLELLHASTDYCVLLLSHRLCHHPSWKGFAWPGKENERYISSFQRRPKCAERWDSCGQSRSGKYRSLGSYVDSICRYTFAKKKKKKSWFNFPFATQRLFCKELLEIKRRLLHWLLFCQLWFANLLQSPILLYTQFRIQNIAWYELRISRIIQIYLKLT